MSDGFEIRNLKFEIKGGTAALNLKFQISNFKL